MSCHFDLLSWEIPLMWGRGLQSEANESTVYVQESEPSGMNRRSVGPEILIFF